MDPALILAGAFTGFVVGLTGVGGGALMTPLLILVFGVAPVAAIATDLWFATITKLAGLREHQRSGGVDWQVAKRLWLGSIPVAIVVVVVVGLGGDEIKVTWLTKAVGVAVLLTAIGLIIAPRLTAYAQRRSVHPKGGFQAAQRTLTVASGAVLGTFVALTSVGAGAIGSVLMLLLYPLRLTPHRLVATDLAQAIPLAAVAGIGYLLAGRVQWEMLSNLLMGSLPAVLIGSRLASQVSARRLQIALAVVLIATGIKVLLVS